MSASPKVHVLWVTTGLGAGGAEMMLCGLAGSMDAGRFRHSVVSLTSGGKYAARLRDIGADVFELDMKPGRPGPGALLRLAGIIRRSHPDVIMGWMYHGNLAALLARVMVLSSTPVIANVRQSLDSLADEKRGSAMVIRILAKLSRGFRAIIYNSQRSVGQHEALGYNRSRSVLIPNGINTGLFVPSPESRAALRKELGLEPDAKLVGRVGRFHPMKDHACFFEAAAAVSREMPSVHFVLAGDGVTPSCTELSELAGKLENPSHVHFLGERPDVPSITAALDVACSSSAYGEGFPNVIAEAMSCGVPCAATDVGDTAFVAGPDARIVAPRNPGALAGAMLDLLRLPDAARHEISERVRRRMEENFSLKSARAAFEQIINRHASRSAANLEKTPCAA